MTKLTKIANRSTKKDYSYMDGRTDPNYRKASLLNCKTWCDPNENEQNC